MNVECKKPYPMDAHSGESEGRWESRVCIPYIRHLRPRTHGIANGKSETFELRAVAAPLEGTTRTRAIGASSPSNRNRIHRAMCDGSIEVGIGNPRMAIDPAR